jgi:hypothetical protein
MVVVLALVVLVLIGVLGITWGFVVGTADETIKKSGHSGFQFGGGMSPSGLKSLAHGSRHRFLSIRNYFVDVTHVTSVVSHLQTHAILWPLLGGASADDGAPVHRSCALRRGDRHPFSQSVDGWSFGPQL